MRILIVGNGGREHALLWKLGRDEPSASLYATRPNGGMAGACTAVDLSPMDIGPLAECGPPTTGSIWPSSAPKRRWRRDWEIGCAHGGVPVFGPSAGAARIGVEQGVCQEPDGKRRGAHGPLRGARRPRPRSVLHPGVRGAPGGQGVGAGGGQGGGRLRLRGGSRPHGVGDARGLVRRGGATRRDRGVHGGRGAFRVLPGRRRGVRAPAAFAGPQAGGRRRHGAEHRRDGGLRAGWIGDGRPHGADRQDRDLARPQGARRGGPPLQRPPLRRPDDRPGAGTRPKTGQRSSSSTAGSAIPRPRPCSPC